MYQALYRKYRPQTFDDVVGQRSVTDTLKGQLAADKLSHAYLFTGTRGTGKTSCAKILAKAVNCEAPHDGNPCNQCAACRAIDSGACVDVLEIDAASNNGVDHVRTLRDEAVYTPSQVKRRVYIIDEVHMLSMAAFNALLKIIEEPPEHLLFILATTELHKVPATILSRCQRFSFRRLQASDIAARLNYVAYEEGIDLRQEAAELLASLADGALRDGLSLLDQCAAVGAVTVDTVCTTLGLAGSRNTAALLGAIADGDVSGTLALFSQLYAAGKDLAALLNELSSLARDLLILKTAPNAGSNMLSGIATAQERKPLLDKLSPAELLRMVTVIQKTAAGFAVSANRRLDTELCLMELASPALATDLPSLNARIGKLEAQLAAGFVPQAPAPPPAVRPTVQEDPKPAPQPAPKPVNELPGDFWSKFTEKLASLLEPHQRAFLAANGAFAPRLRKGVLYLESDNELALNLVGGDAALLETMSRLAASLLGGAVRLVVQKPSTVSSGDPMADLLAFGKEHSDIIKINQ